MKTWKLVAGILGIVFCMIVLFQSCAAGMVNTLDESSDAGGSAGLLVALLMLAGGIVSVAVRNSEKRGGDIALIVVFVLAALIGFSNAAVYQDLVIWSVWCLINAGLALISAIRKKK